MAKSKTTNDAGGGTSQPGTTGASIATPDENNALEHSQGGSTTRQDGLDAGVPMLQGSPNEPVGPEDALGPGPKRGDYTSRVGPGDYQPHQAVKETIDDPENPGQKITRSVLQPQRPRTEDIGEVAGKKGGVETADPNDPGKPAEPTE